jgi:hypothetical protein
VTIVLPITFHFLSKNQRIAEKICGSQTFHNYFLKGLETAPAFTKPDADMRRSKRLASIASIAVATVALSACGADDSSVNASTSSPPVADSGAQQHQATSLAAALPDASPALAVNPAAASDPITQNMQASLAADTQQVTPVMHYAPGDSASNN